MRMTAVALVWLAAAGAGLAQPQPGNVVISASLIDAWLARADVPGQSNPSLPTTGIGGDTLGVALGVDLVLTRRLGITAELSTSGDTSDHQEATKYLHKVRHRDTLLSAYARLRLRPEARVRVEPVVGASLVFSDMRIASSLLTFVPSQHYGPFGDYERWPYGHLRFAVSAGVDVPIGYGRVIVVPTFRLHSISRDEETKNQIGLGRWAIRPGIGFRFSF